MSLDMSGRCAAGQHLLSLPKTCDSSSDRYGLLMISASLMLPLYVLAGRLRCPRTSGRGKMRQGTNDALLQDRLLQRLGEGA